MAATAQPRFTTRPVDPNAVSQLQGQGISPAMARILAARGIESNTSLNYVLNKALPVASLTNAKKMASLIADKMERNERFCIVADYDSDGATACAIGVRALKAFGANIDFMVPNRFIHGYGLTPDIVKELAERDPRPDCIITVDNGIASVAGIEAANALGIKVLVTDHHLPGDTIPAAECIVNPNQPGCTFESKNLAGCGVIFYVMLALKQELTARKWFDTHPNFNVVELLDYVALGTVADVVKLDDNNRRLVSVGLERMRQGLAHPGVSAILTAAGRNSDEASTFDMGFAVGPRLNAAGRLDDMSIGITCLLEDNPERAKVLADQLDALNRERRKIEGDMLEKALAILDTLEVDMDNKYSVVLCDPSWHEGVIGILASRIKDRHNRPTIMMTRTHNGEVKGSCRSIPSLHMRDALDIVYKQNPGMIKKFGGHSMAAGLTIMEDDFPAFTVAFEEACRSMLPASALELVVETDGALSPLEMSMDFAKEIKLQVWGQGFPEPMFQGEFKVLKQRQVGKNEEHAKLTLGVGDAKFDAIFFHQADPLPETIRAIYSLDINNFNDVEKVSLRVQKFQDLDAPVYVQNAEFVAGPDGLSM